jgi:hypothetical protein
MGRAVDRRVGRVSCALLVLLLLNLGAMGCGEEELMSAEIVVAGLGSARRLVTSCVAEINSMLWLPLRCHL